jgi:hypothetical protein
MVSERGGEGKRGILKGTGNGNTLHIPARLHWVCMKEAGLKITAIFFRPVNKEGRSLSLITIYNDPTRVFVTGRHLGICPSIKASLLRVLWLKSLLT